MDYPIVEPILELKYFEIWGFKVHSLDSFTTFPCSVQMRIYPNSTVIRSMGTIKIITWYAFNNATWESVLVRILQYFYCVLITMPVTTSNYHSWLSNSVRPNANDHSKHGNIVIKSSPPALKPNVKFWGWTKQINFVGLKMLSTSPLRFLDCCVISSIVLQRFFPLVREKNWKHGARTPSNLKLRTNVLLCYHYGTFVFVNTHTHVRQPLYLYFLVFVTCCFFYRTQE